MLNWRRGSTISFWRAAPQALGRHYLSNVTCLMRPHLFCVLRRVRGHPNLPHRSPLLKKTSVRRVVFDKWCPLRLSRAGGRYTRSALLISTREISNRGSNIQEPLLAFASKCPLKVQISQEPGPFVQIELLKTDRIAVLVLEILVLKIPGSRLRRNTSESCS